jgi:glycosyltransferase involved in cell wall biosynthesis
MSAPAVSVCIVTFNQERYIRDCVMSVVQQAEDVDIEILVGDDRSSDGTQAIMESLAEQFPTLVRYRRNPEQLGPIGNYQSLIEVSRGSLIAHLDGDDLWVAGKLAEQIAFLNDHPDCPAVYTNAYTISEDGSSLGLFNNPQQDRIGLDYLVSRGNFLCHSSMIYRAKLKQEVLDLPLSCIDYRIHLRLARHGEIGYLNEPLVKYRVQSSSSMLIHSNDTVRQLYWEALMDVPQSLVSDKALTSGISEFGRSVFFASLKKGDVSLLRKWIPLALAAAPGGRVRALFLMLLAIVRVGARESYEAIRSYFNAARPRILYRR